MNEVRRLQLLRPTMRRPAKNLSAIAGPPRRSAIRSKLFVSLLVISASLPSAASWDESSPRPIGLAEALETAIEQNPNIEAAQQRIVAARATIVQAQSAFFPTVTVGQSYTASNSPVRAFMMTLSQRAFDFNAADFNHPGTVDNFGTRLIGRWQIYNGGRDAAGLEETELAVGEQQDNLEAALDALTFEVKRAYYETLKTQYFVAAAEAAVTDRDTSRKLAENLRDAGAALETDVLDAEVALAAARADLVGARSALSVAQAILSSIVGGDQDEQLTAAEPEDDLTKVSAVPMMNAPDYRQRPELAAARKRVEQAEKRLHAARGGWLPRLSAFGGYDLDSGDFKDFADSWIAGVNVELDLFDGLRTRGAVAAAEAERSVARAALRRTELALDLDWRRAQLGVEETAARLATTAVATEQATRSLEITRERYREGLELFSRVLNAETALADARQRRAAAATDYQIAIAALELASGRARTEQTAGNESASVPAVIEGKP